MCDKEKVLPEEASKEDAHIDWLNKVTTHLIKKVNTNIHVTQEKNKLLKITNISELDLANLEFLTNTDHNNIHGKIVKMAVSIPGNNNGSLININIPGLSETICNIFEKSDAEAFLSLNKSHKPFKYPFSKVTTSDSSKTNNNLSVGDYIDIQTYLNHLLPKTTGVNKIYSLAFSSKHPRVGMDDFACTPAGLWTIFGVNVVPCN